MQESSNMGSLSEAKSFAEFIKLAKIMGKLDSVLYDDLVELEETYRMIARMSYKIMMMELNYDHLFVKDTSMGIAMDRPSDRKPAADAPVLKEAGFSESLGDDIEPVAMPMPVVGKAL